MLEDNFLVLKFVTRLNTSYAKFEAVKSKLACNAKIFEKLTRNIQNCQIIRVNA